jgi:hypothetical protein
MSKNNRTFRSRKPHKMRTKLIGTGENWGGSETSLERLGGTYLGNSRTRAREILDWVRDTFNADGVVPGYGHA